MQLHMWLKMLLLLLLFVIIRQIQKILANVLQPQDGFTQKSRKFHIILHYFWNAKILIAPFIFEDLGESMEAFLSH